MTAPALSPAARRREAKAAALEAIEQQREAGALTIRQATPEERAKYGIDQFQAAHREEIADKERRERESAARREREERQRRADLLALAERRLAEGVSLRTVSEELGLSRRTLSRLRQQARSSEEAA